jgi:hypothetical protein
MQWFGESWGAPVCEHCEHVATPVGKICVECQIPIAHQDLGFVVPFLPYPPKRWSDAHYHRDCFLRIFRPGVTQDFLKEEPK